MLEDESLPYATESTNEAVNSATRRAAQQLTEHMKQIAQRAIEGSSDLPSLRVAQRLATLALERLYATLR